MLDKVLFECNNCKDVFKCMSNMSHPNCPKCGALGSPFKVEEPQWDKPTYLPTDEEYEGDPPTAFDIQEGGSHYKNMAIQPTEYCQKNELNACESNIVKYASRHKLKGGLEDVKKIIHYAQLLAEMEYDVKL